MSCEVRLVLSCMAVGTCTMSGFAQLSSTFDSSTEGWTAYGDGVNLRHESTGGNPGGHILVDDGVQGTYFGFVAPSSYYGDRSSYFCGLMRWDIITLNVPNTSSDDIYLTGNGITIIADVGDALQNQWSTKEVFLDKRTQWKKLGSAASQADVQAVLANLSEIRILGEYHSSSTPDTGGLDNVVMIASQPCYADCDENCQLNILDYICFGDAFSSQQAYADCDQNTSLNILDYICFGNQYAAGCQ